MASLAPKNELTTGALDAVGTASQKLSALLTVRTTVVVLLICLSLVLLFADNDDSILDSRPKLGPLGPPASAISIPHLPPGVAPAATTGPEADKARSINDGIAIIPAGRVTAMPFFWAGSMTDRERATDCLAAAGYYEAGTRPVDQRAVMQVVLNRVRHRAFPHSICGVVFQGAERSTGCQFTFACDGSLLRRQPSAAIWRQARMTASAMMTGQTEAAVGHATHYHTDWVHPAWSSQMDKIAAIDTHLFFRWRGNIGEPGSFSTRYSGSEPLIAKLAALSIAHRGEGLLPADTIAAAPPFVAAAISPARPENMRTAAREILPDQARAPDADVFLVALEKSGADDFVRQAEQACAGKATCRFLGWTNPAQKSTQFPVSGRAIDTLSFSYVRQGTGDAGKARWNCAEFPRSDRAQCLRRGG
jgi:hypothetical protein